MSRLADWFRDTFVEPDPIAIDLSPKRPRIASVRRAPTREAFEAWRDDPVTEFIFAAMRRARDAQMDGWNRASWEGGAADQELLTTLRARADAYMSLEESEYEAFCEWNGVEPEQADA